MAERLFRRSSIVTAVPGLLILVPGAIGFRSVTSMVGDQYEDGIAIAFHMGLIGISLVAGMLVGNVATSAIQRGMWPVIECRKISSSTAAAAGIAIVNSRRTSILLYQSRETILRNQILTNKS
jgi:hypothetical protein